MRGIIRGWNLVRRTPKEGFEITISDGVSVVSTGLDGALYRANVSFVIAL
jgi:hypothetical protein